MLTSNPANRVNSQTKLFLPGNDLLDHSPSARPITNNGGVTVVDASPAKKALLFGSPKYLTTPISTELNIAANKDFCIDFFVRTTDAFGSNPRVVCAGDYDSNGWWVYLQTANLGLGVNGNSIYNVNWPSAPISGVWYHVAMERYNGTFGIAVNGVFLGTATWTGAATGTTSLSVGVNSIATTKYYLNGAMADIRVAQFSRWRCKNFVPPNII